MALLLGTASASVTLDASGFTAGTNEAIRSLGDLDKASELSNRKTQAIGVGLLGLSGAIGGVFTYGTLAAIDFNEQMANVNSIAQLSTEELGLLSDQVLELATVTGQAPETLAAGLYDVASSGFAGADGLLVLEAAAYAATAGMTTTDVAAKGITAVLNAYNLEATEAGRVSDVMFQTVNEGVITFDELSSNMGNVLPIANALGVSFESIGAAYALMTLNGVSASQAETQIAALMRAAINPTQALTDATIAYGYATPQALIAAEGFTGYLNLLNTTAGGSSEKLFDLVGTTEGVNAALILGANNGEDYASSLDRMGKASDGAGATQTALSKQMESTSFSLKLLKSNVQAAGIALGVQLEPAIRVIAKGMTGAVKAFLNFSKPVQQVIGAIAGLIGVVAGAAGAWIVFGSTISLIGSILGTIALPILAIVAALAGLYLAWESNFLGIRDITSSTVDAISSFLEPVTGFLGRFKDAWDATAPPSDVMSQINAWGGIVTEEMTLAERAINALDVATGGLVTRLQEMTAVDMVVSIGSWAFETAVDLGSALFSWVGGQLVNLVQNIPGIVVNIAAWLPGAIPDLWDTVMSWGFGGGGGGKGTPTGAAGGGASAAHDITIGSILVNISEWAKGAIADLGAALLGWANDSIINADWSGIGATAKDKLLGAITGAFSLGQDIGESIAGLDTIATTMLDNLTTSITGADWNNIGAVAAQMLINALKAGIGTLGTLVSIGPVFIAGIIDGIAGADWASIATSIKNFIIAAIEGLSGFALGFGMTLFSELQQALGSVDWGSLASTIGTKLGGAISAVSGFAVSLGGKLFDELSQALANVSWGDLASTIGSSLATAISNVTGFAVEIGGKLFDELSQGLANVDWASLGSTIKDGFVGAVAGVGEAIGSAIYEELPGWLTDLIGGVLPGKTDDVVTNNDPNGAGAAGGTLRDDLFQGRITLPDFSGLDAAKAQLDAFRESSRGVTDDLKAAFATPVDTSILTSSFLGLKDTITASMAEVGTSITSGLSAAMQLAAIQVQGMQIGQAFVTGIQQGITTGSAAVGSAISTLVSTAGNARIGMSVAGIAVGWAFGDGAASGIRSKSGTVGSAAGSYVSSVSGYRGSMMAAGLGLGWALGDGVAAGIRSKIGAVAAEAAALVTNAIAAAKAAGAVSSPSRIMDEEVGQMLGLGAALGVEKMYRRMAQAMSGLIMIPAVPNRYDAYIPEVPNRSFAANGGGGTTVIYQTTIEAPVTVEGNIIAEERLIDNAADRISQTVVQRVQQRNIALGLAT